MQQWITGLFVGLIIAWATQALQTLFKKVQYRDEKLLNLYAEFVGALSSDLDRAKSIDAMIALSGADASEEALAEFRKLDEKRHELRRELSRLAFLIRMLEKDEKLRAMVRSISTAQPFMAFAFPPQYGKGNFDERSMKYTSDIRSFNASIESLVDAVQRKHSDFFGSLTEPPQ